MDLVQAVKMHEVMTGVNNPLALSLMAVMAVCSLYVIWQAGMRAVRFIRLLSMMR
ncbi:hypothetical protein [Pantoea dispersa]|uniref:hypothetical protein n=1 Tax=Pantoea dispersa TaxID=59814 RepID=UPI0021F78C47|nr:hypothetical protein [Pantoea dispersa]MCW0323785.1 hypothetical protein [Pantoea dispersa]MCW0328521.1 hypothetical protein [Pantoea dispersa]MCW0434946.1 hypothetical protein [Pantoea dispersa]